MMVRVFEVRTGLWWWEVATVVVCLGEYDVRYQSLTRMEGDKESTTELGWHMCSGAEQGPRHNVYQMVTRAPHWWLFLAMYIPCLIDSPRLCLYSCRTPIGKNGPRFSPSRTGLWADHSVLLSLCVHCLATSDQRCPTSDPNLTSSTMKNPRLTRPHRLSLMMIE